MDALALFEELRVMAKNGLVDADSPYDRERYERLLELASIGYGEALDYRSLDAIANWHADHERIARDALGE